MTYLILKDDVITTSCEHMCDAAIQMTEDTVLLPNQTAFISLEGKVMLPDSLDAAPPDGFSSVRSPQFALGKKPDGKGGWTLPPPPPKPDATSVLNWQLSATLASKGLSFSPAEPTLAARWQFEPSFAIEGVVAKALQASLSYNDAQLQALFNEAAAIK